MSNPSDSTSAVSTPGVSFKHRRIGRCASPPIWGCYELDPGDCSVSESEDDDAESGEDCDDSDGAISIIVAPVMPLEIDPANIPLPPSPLPVVANIIAQSPDGDTLEAQAPAPAPTAADPASAGAGSADDSSPLETPQNNQQDTNDTNANNDNNDCTVCENSGKLDKGKGREVVVESPIPVPVAPPEQCSPSTPVTRRTRRNSRSNRRTVQYRPILTIRSSHGWLWNQELFVPSYMKDRYISYPPDPTPNDPLARDQDYDCIGITLTPEDLSQVLPP